MSGSKKCLYTQDLLLMLVLSFLSIVFVLFPPFNETPVRTVLALLLIFLVPGYAFISAVFPGNREISSIERFTLSVAFSLVIFVFNGFIISVTQWKFRPDSITVSLFILTIAFVFMAWLSRRRLPIDEQFSFSLKGFILSLQEDDTLSVEQPDDVLESVQQSETKRFKAKTRSKVSSFRNPSEPKVQQPEKKRSDVISPEVTKALMIAMVLSIVIAGAMFAYAKVTREKEIFSTLYILGEGGKAEGYPSTFSMQQPAVVIAGIENYEHDTVNYTLRVRLGGVILDEHSVTLRHKEKWEQKLSIKPSTPKQGKQRLEFLLYKGAEGGIYRSVHLWVTQTIDSGEAPVEETINEPSIITLVNPSMEENSGWVFSVGSGGTAIGSYVDKAGIYQSRAYVINSTSNGTLQQVARHSVSQEFQSPKADSMLLSVYLKDSYTKGTSGKDESQFKQISLNGVNVWSDGINGDKKWQRLQVPVTLKEGTNTLTFTLMQSRNAALVPVEFVIDEVSFMPMSDVSPFIRPDYSIEFDLPVSKVLPLLKSITYENFTVSWNGTDVGSGIDYYNIDYSTDGTNWQRWLSKTTATSGEFYGKAGTSYYFRSMAVDKANNREPVHTTPDTSTSIDVSRLELTLDITPNPTSGATNLIVVATRPLNSVVCTLSSKNFGVTETVKLGSKDGGVTWTGKYTLKVRDNFVVEVVGTDFSNETGYTFGTIYSSESTLEKLSIRAYPEKTSGDIEIGVTPSTALQDTPKVTVQDRNAKVIPVEFMSRVGDEYRYKVKIDNSFADGVARITAKAKTTGSANLFEEQTFIIDRVGPTFQSITPESGGSVSLNSPTIRASYSDDRSGIDRDKVVLLVNGIDVTSSADVGSTSILYVAQGLANGPVSVELSITDGAGNTAKKTWGFVVDVQ